MAKVCVPLNPLRLGEASVVGNIQSMQLIYAAIAPLRGADGAIGAFTGSNGFNYKLCLYFDLALRKVANVK